MKTKNLVCGVGINDMERMSRTKACIAWKSMLQRCYSAKFHVRQPTYIDCEVCEEWKTFSNFYAWYVKQDIPEGWQLDKDILTDSKVYSPETCVFVSGPVNTLFTDSAATRGEWPEGVSLERGKFRAQLRMGDSKHLGLYDTPEEAHAVYCKAKLKYCYKVAAEVEADGRFDPRVAPAIRDKAEAKYALTDEAKAEVRIAKAKAEAKSIPCLHCGNKFIPRSTGHTHCGRQSCKAK